MKAAVFHSPGQPLSIVDLPDPTPGEGEVILKVCRCGICGSDLELTSGRSATRPAGGQLGHEYAGEVVALGQGVRRLRVGDRVTALPGRSCGHCEACLSGNPVWCASFRTASEGFGQYVAVGEVGGIRLPDHLDFDDGALVEPLAVALHAVRMAMARQPDKVLVIGAGPIGLGVAFWARTLGLRRIAVVDLLPEREALARTMGASHFLVRGEKPRRQVIDALGGEPDIVFDAISKPGVLADAIHLVRPRGAVVSLSFCTVPDSFVPAVAMNKEVSLHFSKMYSVADYQRCVDVLSAGAVAPRAMVTDTIPLSGLPQRLEALRHHTTHDCKVLVDPWGDAGGSAVGDGGLRTVA